MEEACKLLEAILTGGSNPPPRTTNKTSIMDDKPLSSLIGKTIGGFAYSMNVDGTFNYTSLQMLDDKGVVIAVINPDYMHSSTDWSPFDDDVTKGPETAVVAPAKARWAK